MFPTDQSSLATGRKHPRLDDSGDEARGDAPGLEKDQSPIPTKADPSAAVHRSDPRKRICRPKYAPADSKLRQGQMIHQAKMIQQRREIDGILRNIAPAPRQEVLNNALITLIQLIGLESVVAVVQHEAKIYSSGENERLNRFQKFDRGTQLHGHKQNDQRQQQQNPMTASKKDGL